MLIHLTLKNLERMLRWHPHHSRIDRNLPTASDSSQLKKREALQKEPRVYCAQKAVRL